MENQKSIISCFEELNKRLFYIQISNPIEILSQKIIQSNIDSIVENGIFQFDHEIAIDYLMQKLNDINRVSKKITWLIKKVKIPEKEENPFIPVSSEVLAECNYKKELKVNLLNELSFYKKQLNVILERIEKQFNELGSDRFSNAGFKMKFNLTNEDIVHFFRALTEKGFLQKRNQDNVEITNTNLAEFIHKNFVSKKGSISTGDIKNLFGPSKRYSKRLEDIFYELYNHVKS